jgi:NitT/TauT family transport system permease protein
VIYAAIGLGAIPLTLATVGLSGTTFLSNLPTATIDLSYSFSRMLAAYALSLGFALAYGYYASSRRNAERVMIPVLDILQSVPILGFFPVAIVFLVEIFGTNSWIGPNLASVFLIFTSMSWNMVFGVYESLKTLPPDLKEAADSFGSSGMQRMRRVLFPATVNRLVYNSILSWTGGWFFLVAAEIFTTGTQPLAGIGSYLSFAASAGNGSAFLAGLLPLVILIAALDFLVWRPLSRTAEKYRYDQAPSGEAEIPPERVGRTRRAVAYVTRGVRGLSRIGTPFAQLAAYTSRASRLRERPRARSALGYIALGAVLVVVWLILILLIVAVYHIYTVPIPSSIQSQMLLLPLAMGASTLRVVAAFGVCIAIALPLALYLTRHRHAARVGLPLIEILASFPATALFPVIVFVLIPYLTPNGASVLMIVTGMLWYLFFNLLSGLRSVPPDLEEAARSFGLSNRDLVRKVLLPGSFAALVTGSITAFGGGWNTLIVAEYLNVGGHTFQVFGIGQVLDVGYANYVAGVPGANALWVGALFTLVVTVIALNELIWKPLYRRAVTRYRYD